VDWVGRALLPEKRKGQKKEEKSEKIQMKKESGRDLRVGERERERESKRER
jgi:hypothetical protein